MIVCNVCTEHFNDSQTFLKHMSLTHAGLTVYRCTESTCDKTFSLLNSFIKHRRAKHSSEKPKATLPEENQISLLTPEFGRFYLDFEEESSSDEPAFPSVQCIDSSDSSDCDSILEEDFICDEENFKYSPNLLQEVPKCAKDMNDKSTQFVGKLYNCPDLSRSRINTIINSTSELLESSKKILTDEICSRLKKCGVDESCLLDITDVIANITRPFHNMQTEAQRFSQFKHCNTFIFPQNYKIGERVEYKSKPTGAVRENVSVHAQFIPIRLVLKHFFEMPGVFSKTMEYNSSLKLNNTIISNIIQSPHWKTKIARHGLNKIVLPFILFFDDYETNNPLGSHKGISKCGAVYLTLPSLPPNFQSKLENIFLFILFNSLDRSNFKNSIIFEKIVQEIKFLQEEGITLNLPDGKQQVYFELALIIGDNLGLHSILGFFESFRATKFCRFCLTDNKDINIVFNENDCILRDIDNYNSSFRQKDQSESGIKEFCIFNKIPGFHVTLNPSVDVMHDFLEGICRYDLALILYYFIYVRKYFSLELLNINLRSFYYGPNKSLNKPPEILETHLKKKTKCIVLSSAEMLNLINNLPLMIGFYVDEDDEHWQILLSLKEIAEIIFSSKITSDTPKVLECKISEYLNLLVSKYPHSLKPKHHFFIHYPSVMKIIGPLWNISCMRCEAKNREGKNCAQSSLCRINVCRTIALRHQMILNYRFLCNNSDYPTYVCGSSKLVSLKNLPGILDYCDLLLNYINEDTISVTGWIDYNGKTISKDSVIIIFSELQEEFYRVHLIILQNKDEFLLVVKSMRESYLNEHLRAYKVYENEDFQWDILRLGDLKNAEISYLNKMVDGHFYVSKSWF